MESAEVIEGIDELFGKVSKTSKTNFNFKDIWKFKFKEYEDPNLEINKNFVDIIKESIDNIENGKNVACNLDLLKATFENNFETHPKRNKISLMLFHEPISKEPDSLKIQEQIYNKSNVYSAAVKNSKYFATVLLY